MNSLDIKTLKGQVKSIYFALKSLSFLLGFQNFFQNFSLTTLIHFRLLNDSWHRAKSVSVMWFYGYCCHIILHQPYFYLSNKTVLIAFYI